MTVNFRNIPIHFSDSGKGSAIVLLHGFLENKEMWSDVTNTLSKTNRVVCIDLLGHGKTDCLGYMHTMEEMAEIVFAVLKLLRLRKVKLVGHSMGGYVALAFAEKNPEMVKSICLMNSTAQADSTERKELRSRANQMAQKNYSNMVKMSIANLFSPENVTQLKPTIEIVKKEALKTPLQGYMAAQEGMKLRPNRENVVKNIPTTYIIGEKDPIINANLCIKEAKRNNATYHVLNGGHMSHLEDLPKLLEAFRSFIQ